MQHNVSGMESRVSAMASGRLGLLVDTLETNMLLLTAIRMPLPQSCDHDEKYCNWVEESLDHRCDR